MIRQRNIRRRPQHLGVINQEMWSAHGRRRLPAHARRVKEIHEGQG